MCIRDRDRSVHYGDIRTKCEMSTRTPVYLLYGWLKYCDKSDGMFMSIRLYSQCRYVCPFAYLRKPHVQTSRNFLCALPAAVARSFSTLCTSALCMDDIMYTGTGRRVNTPDAAAGEVCPSPSFIFLPFPCRLAPFSFTSFPSHFFRNPATGSGAAL